MAKDKDGFKVLQTVSVPVGALVLTDAFRGRSKPVQEDTVIALADNLRTYGQMQAVQARESKTEPGKYEVIFGNTRTRAFKMLNDGYRTVDGNNKPKDIPADSNVRVRVEVVDVTDEQAFKQNIIENQHREACSAIDTAKNQDELRTTHGMTDAAITRLYGWPNQSAVTRLKSLLKLPEFVQDKIHRGDVPASAGYFLASADDLVTAGETAFERVFAIAKDNGESKQDTPGLRYEETSYTHLDIATAVKEWRKEQSDANKPKGEEGTQEEGNGNGEGNGEQGTPSADATPAVSRVAKTLKQYKDFASQVIDDPKCPPKTKETFIVMTSFLKDELTDVQALKAIMALFDEYPLENQAEGVEEPGHVHVNPASPDEMSMNPHTPKEETTQEPAPTVPQAEPAPSEVPPPMQPAPPANARRERPVTRK